MWDVMKAIIEEAMNKFCPLKETTINENTPDWLNRDFLSEINIKDYLYKKAKRSGNQEDWDLFKKKKAEVKRLLATAKENFIKGKIDELEKKTRKCWRTINNLSGLGKNKNGRKCTKIIDDSGKTYENSEAATFLNNFYVNVGPNLARNHKKEWVKRKCNIAVNSTFNFSWVTEIEVRRLVKDICITKSSALDDLSTRLLKYAFEVLIFELTYMYNACLQNAVFPESWGLSKVTPIPKTNTKSTKPGDWRPISQICLPGKLLEKIIHMQLSHRNKQNSVEKTVRLQERP